MGSSGAEEPRDEIINPPGVHGIGEAENLEAGTRLEAGETEPPVVDRGDFAAPDPTGVPQQGAGELAENERHDKLQIADAAVFGDIEEDLEKHDERERLLAEAFRDSEKHRKEVAKARRKSDGNTTYQPVESDRDTNDDKSCYIDIKNLVLIETSVIHKKALEEWDRKEKLFASRVERKSTKVESRKNEVYQLIGFFSVFQGVMLTAVSQTNLLHCNNWWSPILLSVLASIVTIGGVAQKLLQIDSLEKTIYSEEQALKDVVHRGQDLRRTGKDFVFAKFSDSKKKGVKKGYFTWYALGVISFLLVFTLVFPLSHWRILCHPGRDPYGGVRIKSAKLKRLLAAMDKITLKNNLKEKEVQIREGNAGIMRELYTLKPGKTFDIRNDPNATYREYIFITLPDNTELRVLTSDDFAELKEISIFEEDGKYDWMGTIARESAQVGPIKRFLHRIGIKL